VQPAASALRSVAPDSATAAPAIGGGVMSGPVPEEVVAWPVVRQTWRNMAFLHWAVEPDRLRKAVPSMLGLDLLEGRAWLGLTAFEVADFRVGFAPPVPGVSRYPETNVRTYVRTAAGQDGIWFFTLEVDSATTVVGGRSTLGLPYRWARMHIDTPVSGVHRYDSERRRGATGAAPHHRIEVRHDPESVSASADLDHFLTGRWRAFSRPLGRLVVVPVEHEPWPLHAASIVDLDQTLLTTFGVEADRAPDHVLWSPGVHARIGAPRCA
jgi:uncharacterized protein